jgi:Ca2+-binding EF-hand superfamily protein
MKLITTILAVVAAGSFACAADREDQKKEGDKAGPRDKAKQQEEMFKQMDANSDGKVSKEEYNAKMGGGERAAAAAERFIKMDRNKDGELTKREFTTPIYESAGDRRKAEAEKSGESDK